MNPINNDYWVQDQLQPNRGLGFTTLEGVWVTLREPIFTSTGCGPRPQEYAVVQMLAGTVCGFVSSRGAHRAW